MNSALNRGKGTQMGKVIFHNAVSLDGFVAGPNDGPDNGLGDGGARLHEWYFNGSTGIPISGGRMTLRVSPPSAEFLEEALHDAAADVWGRRTFDIAGAWGGQPPMRPCFIVTHTIPPEWAGEGSPFTFVTDGVASAIRQAKQAAGDKNVSVSTASIMQQCLRLGLLDEINISVIPILLGGGVRLFENIGTAPVELERIRVVQAPGVTHLGFRVSNRAGPLLFQVPPTRVAPRVDLG